MASYRRKYDPSLFKYQKGRGGEISAPNLRGAGKYQQREIVEGYVYQGKVPFRYRAPGGDVRTVEPGERLSSRQYQNLRYQSSGWESKSQFERISHYSATASGRSKLAYKVRGRRVHEVGAFRKWGQIYADKHSVSLNRALAPTSDFSMAFAKALQDDFADLSPDGPFATLLKLVGLRDDEADWNVGDTP